jgi:hypothetical protein
MFIGHEYKPGVALQLPAAWGVERLAANVLAFQVHREVLTRPFEWKLTRADLARLLERLTIRGSGRVPRSREYTTEYPCYGTTLRGDAVLEPSRDVPSVPVAGVAISPKGARRRRGFRPPTSQWHPVHRVGDVTSAAAIPPRGGTEVETEPVFHLN